jgi:hypothetical protein
MTLAAAHFIQGWPILIGDVLISNRKEYAQQVTLPTIHHHVLEENVTKLYSPSGLSQKLTIVNNDLAVGWAGTKLHAKSFIRELLAEYADKKCSISEILEYLNNMDQERRDNISVVGVIKSEKVFHVFGIGVDCCCERLNDVVDVVYVAGTGQRDYLEILRSFINKPTEEGLNPFQYAAGNTIMASSFMMGKELTNLESLINGYGGGYEIISYVNGKFQKIDDINHIIWIANEAKDGQWTLTLPRLFMKYEYHGDIFMIRRGEFLDNTDSNELIQMSIVNECVHLISPIYRYLNRGELEELQRKVLPDLNARFICHSILTFKNSGMVNCQPYLNYSGNGTNPIQFVQKGGQIHIEIEPDLIKSLLTSLSRQTSTQVLQ